MITVRQVLDRFRSICLTDSCSCGGECKCASDMGKVLYGIQNAHVPSAVIHSSFMQAAGKPDPSPRRSEESTPPSGLKASVT